MKTPFLGGYNASRSINLADAQCINLYPEFVDTKDGKTIGALYTTPGLALQFTIGNGPVRGFFSTLTDLWVVSGNELFKIDVNGVVNGVLTMGTAGGAVSMIATGMNIGAGAQLLVADGSQGYLVNTNLGTSVVTFPFPSSPALAAYQDGFGLLVQYNSQSLWQSNLFDLSTWSALAFQDVSSQPDNLVALASLNETIWAFKQNTTQFLANAGTTPFSFQPVPGAILQFGCAASASVSVVGGVVIWLSQNLDGAREVRMGQGYSSERVSTHAIEAAFSQYPTVADAQAYSYQQQGHTFYVLTFPTVGATWAFDLTTQLWHQRASFSQGVYSRDVTNCACVWKGMNLVGDYRNGNIYALTLGGGAASNQPAKWLRSWRALAQPTMEPMRFTYLQIDMETGNADIPPGADPTVMLRWSDDGGHTWSNYRIFECGRIGETTKRVKFNRLGSTRRNHGLDRIFELSSASLFGVGLMGAEIG